MTRVIHRLSIVNILLKNGPDCKRKRSEEKIVEADVERLIERLSTKSAIPSEIKLDNGENDIFIEKVENHFSDSDIGPSAMNKKKFPECGEKREGKVACLNCLHSFLPEQAYSCKV